MPPAARLNQGIPAAVVGVLIAGRAAARLGDSTAYGGSIVGPGAPTAIIG